MDAEDSIAGSDTTTGASIVRTRPNLERFASDRECLIYNPVTDEASSLNQTATEIWTLCDGSRTIAGIACELAQRYGVHEEMFIDEVLQTVASFRARGLVEVAADSPLT